MAVPNKPPAATNKTPSQRVTVIDSGPYSSVERKLAYTFAITMSPVGVMFCRRYFSMGLAGAERAHGSALPEIEAIVPPISPRFLNTRLNSTEYPGVTSPLRIPDCVTVPIKAMHSSW